MLPINILALPDYDTASPKRGRDLGRESLIPIRALRKPSPCWWQKLHVCRDLLKADFDHARVRAQLAVKYTLMNVRSILAQLGDGVFAGVAIFYNPYVICFGVRLFRPMRLFQIRRRRIERLIKNDVGNKSPKSGEKFAPTSTAKSTTPQIQATAPTPR